MTTEKRARANGPGLPTVLSQEEWDELHDALELALDALGDGPGDVDMSYLVNSVSFQREALRLATRRLEAMRLGRGGV